MHRLALGLLLAMLQAGVLAQAPPLAPFVRDEHTLLLYHFDEGVGGTARDAGPHGYDGEVRGATWAKGRFGGGLQFDGVGSCVFRKATDAIAGLRQFTVECWYKQDSPAGRQFLLGKDGTVHCDLVEGNWSSLSLYNRGGSVPNAEGLPHKQVGGGLGTRSGSHWNHLAACYDGRSVSIFLNGILTGRYPAPRDFSIGVADCRGLWIGCYIGMDYWFSGLIDEVRISDCVRYDPEATLAAGAAAFDMPRRPAATRTVRTPSRTDTARLSLSLLKLHGGAASGWIFVKPPGRKAVIVGRYDLAGARQGEQRTVTLDVSDEGTAEGTLVVGLEPVETAGYFELTRATLTRSGRPTVAWSGRARSRRTFAPPILAPLYTTAQRGGRPRSITLLPDAVDRLTGNMELSDADTPGEANLGGDGFAEWWIEVPVETAYRVAMRYATAVRRPCDIVIDGVDLNEHAMCALNATGGSASRNAFWERQGAVRLKPGVHWIRVQDMPPNLFGLRLDPIPALPPARVAWGSYPVPSGGIPMAGQWSEQPLFGRGARASATITNGQVRLEAVLPPGASARISRDTRANLEPFGALRFRFAGSGSGHVIALRLVDGLGVEKLAWRLRDTTAKPVEVTVPLLFEGMEMLDGRRVSAICLDLDEGNLPPGAPPAFACTLSNLRWVRRDRPARPAGPATANARPRGRTLTAPKITPWTTPVMPEKHPLYGSTDPRPVTRATLGYGLHFTGSRDISADALDQFHRYRNFGDVCWPHIGILPQRRDFASDAAYRQALAAMESRLLEVKRRGLFLFDIWGYVPFGEAGPTPRVAPEHHESLTRIFGDRFLGYDNGEQDGRYVGSYSDRGAFTDRRGGWEDFVRWDKGICDDNMGYMDATGSLNYSHYYGERGDRMLGLETAQGLPSDTLMFAFLRGASRQYGRLTSQATSVWSRFGYTMYNDRRTEGGNGYGLGPNKGCSLSLHKRLFFHSYTGGDSICGTETAQFTADLLANGANELSPLGAQHLRIADWVRKHPDRGVMSTPVAFMLDFYNGWNMPRHLYRSDRYKVWGKLPYGKGDHQVDALFRMVWPGYEDASFLRNERGFLCPTPFGDIFDVVNNRCRPEILRQYGAVVLLGDVEMTPTLVTDVSAYVRNGGDLVVDAPRALALPPDLLGCAVGETPRQGNATVVVATGRAFAEQPFSYYPLARSSASVVATASNGDPIITVNRAGKGRVIVVAADYWMTDRLEYAEPGLVNMEPPYRLLEGVRQALSTYLAGFCPARVSPGGLTVRTNHYAGDPGRMLVSLFNNDLSADWHGTLSLPGRTITRATELWHGSRLAPTRSGVQLSIPAGDVAMVEVRVR